MQAQPGNQSTLPPFQRRQLPHQVPLGRWCATALVGHHLAAQTLEFERQHLQLQSPLCPGNTIMPVVAHAESANNNPDGKGQQGRP